MLFAGKYITPTQVVVSHTTLHSIKDAGSALTRGVLQKLQGAVPDVLIVFASPKYDYVALLDDLLDVSRVTGGMITLAEELHDMRDSGIGIDATLLPHVLDLFIQGERSSDRAQGGLGVGLALVKSLVQRHGGMIEAHSRGAGMGSQFILTLPAAGNDDMRLPTPCETVGAAGAAQALSILIVDDNADAASMLATYLEALGHEVRVAFDGEGALRLAAQAAPRVLLLDIGLPDIDGYALARRLRAMPHTSDALFLALTGYGQPEDRARSHAAGFDHHLTKPVDVAELAKLLGRVAA